VKRIEAEISLTALLVCIGILVAALASKWLGA